MCPSNVEHNVTRMCSLALDYLDDASLLDAHIQARSHAAYMIKLTAFEILLKALALKCNVRVRRAHSYARIFQDLPTSIQQELLSKAADRMGGTVSYAEVDKLFDRYERNFVALRYSYESYEGLTSDEVRVREDKWIAEGAQTESADFIFYPEELFGLTQGLLGMLGCRHS